LKEKTKMVEPSDMPEDEALTEEELDDNSEDSDDDSEDSDDDDDSEFVGE
jgi:hypothetical protein